MRRRTRRRVYLGLASWLVAYLEGFDPQAVTLGWSLFVGGMVLLFLSGR